MNSLNSQQTKKPELSLLNIISCMLVILIHIISYTVYAYPEKSIMFNLFLFMWRSASIAVQCFLMLAGIKFFVAKKDEMPYLKYIGSRIKKIVLPYSICFIAYYLLYMLLYDYPFDIAFILRNFFNGNLIYHFYFIPLILQFDLLSPLWKKIINHVPASISIPTAVILTMIFQDDLPRLINSIFPEHNFFYNDRLFTTYLAFYLIGGYIGKNYERFKNILKNSRKIIFHIWIILFLLFCIYTYIFYNNISHFSFMNPVHTLYTFATLLMLFLFAFLKAPSLMANSRILNSIDSVSYHIYLWHVFLILLANLFIDNLKWTSEYPALTLLLRVILIYPTTISLCSLFFRLYKKSIKKSDPRMKSFVKKIPLTFK